MAPHVDVCPVLIKRGNYNKFEKAIKLFEDRLQLAFTLQLKEYTIVAVVVM